MDTKLLKGLLWKKFICETSQPAMVLLLSHLQGYNTFKNNHWKVAQ